MLYHRMLNIFLCAIQWKLVVYPFNKFLLTIGSMLYSRNLELVLYNYNFIFIGTQPLIPPSSHPLVTTILFSASVSLTVLDSSHT